MSRVLVLCPTHRDYREIARLNGIRQDLFFFHDYASLALEELVAGEPPSVIRIGDPEAEVERILTRYGGLSIDSVVSTDDYPGSTLAAVVARALGVPGADPSVDLLCQHKYHSRRAQRSVVPEATPGFELIHTDAGKAPRTAIAFPLIVKPVKSFFSVGACRVNSPVDFDDAVRRATLPRAFFEPFSKLLEKHCGLAIGGQVLAEALLQGRQSTLEGYAYDGEIHVLGVVDSVMFPGTLSFQRFEYPSCLPSSVQERMAAIARQVMVYVGYDNALFNMEFMVDLVSNSVSIIEINPRMSSQFADLFEKVDGANSYNVLLDLAAGKAPRFTRGKGIYARAASCVLRTFENKTPVRLPSQQDIERLQEIYPDVRVEVLATAGRKLSADMQDGHSYRYGIISLGGHDDEEIREALQDCLRRLPFALDDV